MRAWSAATALLVAALAGMCLVDRAAGDCTFNGVDLTNFKNKGVGYTVVDGDYTYAFSVCESLATTSCTLFNVTLCQSWTSPSPGQKGLGTTASMWSAISGGTNLTMLKGVLSTTCGRQNSGALLFYCDQTVTGATYAWKYVGYSNCMTTFSVSHCAACAGGCKGASSGGSSGHSSGSGGSKKKGITISSKAATILGGLGAAIFVVGVLAAALAVWRYRALTKALAGGDGSGAAQVAGGMDYSPAYRALYQLCASDKAGLVSETKLQSLLARIPGVPETASEKLWKMTDVDRKGKATKDRFMTMLRLVSLYQRGQPCTLFEIDRVGLHNIPPPTVENHPKRTGGTTTKRAALAAVAATDRTPLLGPGSGSDTDADSASRDESDGGRRKSKGKGKGKGKSKPALPKHWTEAKDARGQRYFYNSKTGTSQWDRPTK